MAETTPAPDPREIATIARGNDITRGYVEPLLLLNPQDEVLRTRGGGRYEIYREVLRDDQVKAVLSQRQLAVTSREWEVRPGGDKRLDKQAAEFLTEQLDRIQWDAVTAKMLYGVFYGFAAGECLWGRDGSRIVLDAIKVRDRRRFRYDGEGRLRLLTMSAPQGEPLPERKFWTFATGADHDDEPYGLGLAHWLYWPVFFKKNNIKFWLIFLEKFGQPTGKGTYPASATQEERDKLLQALGAIATDAGVIIPEGMVIELIEAARSGTADYTALYDRMNAAIAKVVLGQTLTTEAAGGQYKAEVQMDVRQDLVKADADLVCQSFNLGPARWLTEWNFPGAAIPQVWRLIEAPEDLDTAATRDKTLFEIGYRPTLARIQATYGPDYQDTGPLPLSPPGRGAGGEGAAFAEGGRTATGDQEVIARAAEDLAGDWQRLLGARVEELIALAEETGDLVTFRERLADLLQGNPSDALAESLEWAGFAARLLGRTTEGGAGA